MSKEVLMPQYGLTMEEGAVERWLVKVGDTVKKGDVLAEIATDKLTNDLVSEVEGTVLQLVAKEGVDLPVKAVLAVIGEPGEAMGAAPAQAAPAAVKPAAPEQAPAPAAAPAAKAAPGGRVKVSPFARKLAEKGNVDVSALAGSGPGGRVVAKDVAQAIRAGAAPKAAAPAPAPGPAAQAVPAAGPAAVAGEGDEVVKMSKMRKVVADRMSASAREIPSVSQNVRADVTKLLALRAQVNEGRENRISLNDFILKAAAKALLRHPEVNSALDGNGNIIRYRHAHIGVAVSVPGGLMVPVLRNAEAKGLEALAEEARGLAARARTGSLEGAELQGSTFSVSNLGMYGVTSFTPIINQPNAAILGVCAVEDQPALDGEGRLYNRKVMTLCLTYDHRLIDGAEAAAFEQTLKALLEEPLNILL